MDGKTQPHESRDQAMDIKFTRDRASRTIHGRCSNDRMSYLYDPWSYRRRACMAIVTRLERSLTRSGIKACPWTLTE